MSAPRDMTAETLNALKGWPNFQGAVDFEAKFDPDIAVRVAAGSVLHVNSDGEFALGVGNLFVMPIFAFSASDDTDVMNDAGDAATLKNVAVPISPTGVAMGLVACGSYELVSTNFNTALSYAPNDALTSPLTTGGGVNAGMLTKGTYPAVTCCGVVSRGVINNGYGHDALAFWPVCLPAHTH